MGLYDRDYGRYDTRTPWDQMQNSRSAVVTLVVITVAVFFVQFLTADTALGPQLIRWFSASAETLTRPWLIWQSLTYGFLHDPDNIFHVLFNMFGLFIFGRAVEQRIGGKELTRFYLVAIVLGGLVAAIEGILLGGNAVTLGASGGVVAVVILFACHYPNVEVLLMFVLPVKAWVLAVIFVVYDLAGALGLTGADSQTAFSVHLAGAAFGLLYHFRGWNLRFLDFGAGNFGAGGSLTSQLRNRSRRMKLKLHDPDRKVAQEAAEADRILAKIHESGEESLTSAERRTLERYSKRQRQRRERSDS